MQDLCDRLLQRPQIEFLRTTTAPTSPCSNLMDSGAGVCAMIASYASRLEGTKLIFGIFVHVARMPRVAYASGEVSSCVTMDIVQSSFEFAFEELRGHADGGMQWAMCFGSVHV
jgi:hypothetical protein